MNKKALIAFLVCITAPLLFYYLSAFGSGHTNSAQLGLACFIAGFVYLQPGLIISVVKDTNGYKQVGKGVVLASAILLLLGFSICSISPLSFH